MVSMSSRRSQDQPRHARSCSEETWLVHVDFNAIGKTVAHTKLDQLQKIRSQ